MKKILEAILAINLAVLSCIVFINLSLIHISEPTRQVESNLVCRLLLEKKKKIIKIKKRIILEK